MRIADMLGRSKPTISFEFMAPRDESEVEVLERTVATLAGHAPDWVSVTYRVRTGEIVPSNSPGRDPIVTRILWLRGREAQNANAFGRYIYCVGGGTSSPQRGHEKPPTESIGIKDLTPGQGFDLSACVVEYQMRIWEASHSHFRTRGLNLRGPPSIHDCLTRTGRGVSLKWL